MFSHESTENLLDNLENELSELIELRPRPRSPKQVESMPTIQKVQPPVPARRNLKTSPEITQPIPIPRKISSIDKNIKNDENEIIQLQSLSSDHEISISTDSQNLISTPSHINASNNTVIMINEKKSQLNDVIVVQEGEKMPHDKLMLIKHGKWTDEAKQEENMNEDSSKVNDMRNVEDVKQEIRKSVKEEKLKKIKTIEATPEKQEKLKKKSIEKVDCKIKSKSSSSRSRSSSTSNTSVTMSDSSSSDESSAINKKKKSTAKKSNKKKTTQSEDSSDKVSKTKAEEVHQKIVGIFVDGINSIKYRKALKAPKIKISFFNEDTGKQIGGSMLTKVAEFSNHFL
jgi:hypothetical protein